MASSIAALRGVITFAVVLVILLIIAVIITAILSRKGKKYLGRIITGCLLIIFSLSLIIGFWSFMGIMGPAQSAEDVASQEQEGNFKDHDEGDIVTIRDTISRIDTKPISNKTYVIIWFDSSGSGDDDFNVTFRDDIRGDYNEKDVVVVFLEVVYINATSDIEILRYHAPGKELGARSFQIYPSLFADIWFWLLLLIGIVELVLGILGWRKKKPEGESEEESSETKGTAKKGKDELPDENALLVDSQDSGSQKEPLITDKEGLPDDET
ncbi:MAG: hypothetical protein JSW00_18305 [Thermoplasmata archaeon]|nr:MAG: hypothetical protein JSW00_18305 [Thermoplasmata archaeon]